MRSGTSQRCRRTTEKKNESCSRSWRNDSPGFPRLTQSASRKRKASIPGAEGRTRLILVLLTPSGELRYRIEDWDKHWESFSIGGMF